MDGTIGFSISGFISDEVAGKKVGFAGDFNGDGIDDVMVGAPTQNGYSEGAVYVVFGSDNGFSSSLSLSNLDGINGVRIKSGSNYSFSGSDLVSVGDLNGDGFDDILLGASGITHDGRPYAGGAYVVYGQASFGAELTLNRLSPLEGGVIKGRAERDDAGSSVSGGDINGDGEIELIIGAPLADPNSIDQAGEVYILSDFEFDVATSIEQLILEDLSLAPNPAPGAFTLSSPQATIESVTLYDLTGRRLPAEISHDRHEAQVRSSYRGLTLVKVQTDQGMWVQKVRME